MARLVTCTTIDRPDGRFDVIATIEPICTYRQEGFLSLTEAEEWVEGLRMVMSAMGAPVAHTVEQATLDEADRMPDSGSQERPFTLTYQIDGGPRD
jgi:hypothetical protein